jgi:hypothetical protein
VNGDRQVLESNLELLLGRAYQPIAIRPGFREQVERRVLDVVRGGVPRKGRAPAAWRTSPLVRVALAASIALLLLVAGRELLRSSPEPRGPTLDEILARGELAWRDGRDRPWSAAPAGGATLEFDPPFLEVATPSQAPAEIELDATAPRSRAWELGASSHVEVERARDEILATLTLGSLTASHGAGAPRATISTSEGAVALESNALRVAFAEAPDASIWPDAPSHDGSWVHVSVLDGALALAGGRTLERGGELYLAGGRAWIVRDPAAPGDGGREEVPAPPVVSIAASVPPEPAAAASIEGTVTADGAPLDDFVVVTLRDVALPQVAQPAEHAFRGSGGRFSISDLPRGRYSVFVRAAGRAVRRADRVDVDPQSGEPARLDLELERGATLGGSIVDASTGLPIPDAYVVSETDAQIYVLSLDPEINRELAPRARMRLDGGFELANVSSGRQILRASAPGYGPEWSEEVEVAPGEVRRDLVIRLPRDGRVAGSVLRADGTPVAGSLVLASTTDFESKRPCLTYASTETDAEGRFQIAGLAPGYWAVLEFGPSQQLVVGRFAPELAFTRVRAGETSIVDFHEKRQANVLRGVVLDAAGAPVAGRNVMVAPVDRALAPPDGGWISDTTGPDGTYRIPDLEPGPHEMYVSGRLPPEVTRIGRFEVSEGPESVHDVRLPGGALRGLVLDGERAGEGPDEGGRAPLDLAIVIVYRADGGTRDFVGKAFTDSQGRFEVPFLSDGRYDLYVLSTRDAYGQERVRDLEVLGGGAVEVPEVTLHLGGTLVVDVRDEAGAPVAAAAIELVDESGDPVEFSAHQVTDDSGRFSVHGLRAGRWRVRASAPQGVAESAVEIAAGRRGAVELVVRARR